MSMISGNSLLTVYLHNTFSSLHAGTSIKCKKNKYFRIVTPAHKKQPKKSQLQWKKCLESNVPSVLVMEQDGHLLCRIPTLQIWKSQPKWSNFTAWSQLTEHRKYY